MENLENRCLHFRCNKSNEDLKEKKTHLKTCSRCLTAMFCSASCQKAAFKQHNFVCNKVAKSVKAMQRNENLVNNAFGVGPRSRICWTDTSLYEKARCSLEYSGGNPTLYGYMQDFTDAKIEYILRMYEIAIVNRSPKGLQKVLDEALEALTLVQPILKELRYLTPAVMLELGRIDEAYTHAKYWIESIKQRRTGVLIYRNEAMETQDKEENFFKLPKVVENAFYNRLRVADVILFVYLAIIKYKVGLDEHAEECLELIHWHCPGLIWIFLTPMEEGKEACIPKRIKVKGTPDTMFPISVIPGNDDDGERGISEEFLQKYGQCLNNYLDHRPEVKKKFEDFMVKKGYPKKPGNYGWIQDLQPNGHASYRL